MTRLPTWLKKEIQGSRDVYETEKIISSLLLHTICHESRCPNRGECFARKEATFLILGDICTRACGFCAVKTARPGSVDMQEPGRVAEGIHRLGLHYAVITSVNRDDLPDGGAHIFAETVRETRRRAPQCGIELLVPDFSGNAGALEHVLDAQPDCLSHNIETVPRFYAKVRPKSDYKQSLFLLEHAKKYSPSVVTKSGIMVGFGETQDEVFRVMEDVRRSGCDILTVGQYLSPGDDYLRVHRFIDPDDFQAMEKFALDLGFPVVVCSPFVRTSYRAQAGYEAALRRRKEKEHEQAA